MATAVPKPRPLIREPPPVIEINVGDEIDAPVYEEKVQNTVKGTVKYIGPCEWFVTESKYAEFFANPPNVDAIDTTAYPKFAEALSGLRTIMPLEDRKTILRKMSQWGTSELPPEYRPFLKDAHMMIKRNQILSVILNYKDQPPVTVWYEAHNCNPTTVVPFANGYGGDFPTINDGKFDPQDLEKYALLSAIFERHQNGPQAITSWINHGFLSTWLRKRDEVLRNLTHPFVGDAEFANYIDAQQTKDLETLYAISQTSTEDFETYRSSLFWADTFEPMESRSILATTTNLFTVFMHDNPRSLPPTRIKKLIVTPGVRFLDLRKFNKREGEVLILPELGKILRLLPVKKGTYAVASTLEERIKHVNEYRIVGEEPVATTGNERRKARRFTRRAPRKTRRSGGRSD
jgi:hypothetical protein